ncbi:hypothetical protein Q7P36_002431 [Cladosporium allicinum]
MPSVKIGTYLFTRLKQLGIQTVFGRTTDYELALLDLIGESGVDFCGNPNELIASYAADGYSRVKGSSCAGAFVTTFGPGELSAYCGHAGAYAEFVPVVHVVGYPGRPAMADHRLMHHTLGTGEFGMYHEMAKHISADTVVLDDPSSAGDDIDRVLNTMLHESRPVYIGVPVDMSHLGCDARGLETPLKTTLPPNDADLEREVVAEVRSRLECSENPIIIVDGNAVRNNLSEVSKEVSMLTGLPTFTTCMGKGALDETQPNFGGVYQGAGSHPGVREAVEAADCVLWIGNVQTDFNTGEFTDNVREEVTIDLQRFSVKVGSQVHPLKMVHVLSALSKDLEAKPLARAFQPKVTWDPYPQNNPSREAHLTQDYLWPTLGKFFLPGDFIIGETGTSAFGLSDSKLPRGATMYNQTVYGSIGYATGAALGAFKALRETTKHHRCILVTGEGSLHLTVQAFADFLKLGLNPIVFVLNNDGYTVERLIHGRDAKYNKLPDWDYSKLAPAFGPNFPSKYHGPIATPEALDALLGDATFAAAGQFQLVELKLGYLDAPLSLRLATAAVEEFNAATKSGEGSVGGSMGG